MHINPSDVVQAVEKGEQTGKSVAVDKRKFDAALRRLLRTEPVKRDDLKKRSRARKKNAN